MNVKTLFIGMSAAAALGAAAYGFYTIGMQRGLNLSATTAVPASTLPAESGPLSIAQGEEATRRHIASNIKAGDLDPVAGKRVLYYRDPMTPGMA